MVSCYLVILVVGLLRLCAVCLSDGVCCTVMDRLGLNEAIHLLFCLRYSISHGWRRLSAHSSWRKHPRPDSAKRAEPTD